MFYFLLFAVSMALVDLIGYWLHRLAHSPGNPLYRAHMVHHVKQYPAKRFLSESYKNSGLGSLVLWFTPLFILYVTGWFLILDFYQALAAAAGAAVAALVTARVHDMTHITESFIWRKKVLRWFGAMHYSHHRKMHKNFGIIHKGWDIVFRSAAVNLAEPKSATGK